MTIPDGDIAGVYKLRNPENSAFCNCVENPFEELETIWNDLYAPRYGFWRPYITSLAIALDRMTEQLYDRFAEQTGVGYNVGQPTPSFLAELALYPESRL